MNHNMFLYILRTMSINQFLFNADSNWRSNVKTQTGFVTKFSTLSTTDSSHLTHTYTHTHNIGTQTHPYFIMYTRNTTTSHRCLFSQFISTLPRTQASNQKPLHTHTSVEFIGTVPTARKSHAFIQPFKRFTFVVVKETRQLINSILDSLGFTIPTNERNDEKIKYTIGKNLCITSYVVDNKTSDQTIIRQRTNKQRVNKR